LHATELTKGNLSSHLMRLEKANYVTIEKVFEGKTPRTICRLTDVGRDAFEAYRKQLKAAI
ncbi:MAG: transcriptional regulator, partial [Anaerolineales bacterium]|nr:transcriptional regulator [Anaerolineales bacterium]